MFSASAGRIPITSFGRMKSKLDRRIAALNGDVPIRAWRFHDLRRSMRTNLSAIPSISPLIAELMIGHRQRGIIPVYDVYKYLDEQRGGFEAWCARLRAITEPAPDNVVELVRA